MLLGLDDPSKRKWIGSNLRSINEIAFSEDGKMFAAGGCCLSEKGQSDRDQIWLWSVDKSGLTPTTLTFPLTPFAGGVQDLAFLFSRSCHHISLMTP